MLTLDMNANNKLPRGLLGLLVKYPKQINTVTQALVTQTLLSKLENLNIFILTHFDQCEKESTHSD